MEATASPAAHRPRFDALALAARIPRSLLLVLSAALLWRIPFLVWTGAGIDADEAVLGLMASHIGAGERFPIWYYGQQYMGALEAWVAAPSVLLLGPTRLALKITALLFGLLFTGTTWALARRIFRSEAIATAAGLCAAFGPLFLTLWSLKLRGGFVSIWALGQAVLLVALLIGDEGESPRRNFALGLLAGLALWTNLLVAPYLFAAALYLLSRRRILFSGRGLAVAVGGLLLGSAPFWVYNLVHLGATFGSLPAHQSTSAWEHLRHLATRHLPMLLGAVPPWRADAPLDWRSKAILAGYGFGFAWLVVRHRRDLLRWLAFSQQPTSGAELYVLTAVGFLLCAAFTRFGNEVEARYASVLYSALLPAIALPLGDLWDRRGAGRVAALCLGAALMAFNGWSIYREDARHPTQPLHQLPSGDLVGDMSRLYAELHARGIDTVVAEYWFAQIISFETGEKVAAWSWPVRADYRARVADAPIKAWLFRRRGWDRRLVSPLRRDLSAIGIAAKEEVLDDWILVTAGPEAPAPERWTVTASTERSMGTLGPHIRPANIADRIYQSRWTTQAPQRPGQFLLIDLSEVRALSGFRCYFGDGDVPQRLRVEVSVDGRSFERLAEQSHVPEHWQIAFERETRFVRLTQTGSSPWRWWSVHECYAL